MRTLTEHLMAEGENPATVIAMDEPLPGFAHMRYDVLGFNTVYNPAADVQGTPAHFTRLPIIFQSDPDRPAHLPQDGVSTEALLAVLVDHLQSQLATPQACHEYAAAAQNVQQALVALAHRRQRVSGDSNIISLGMFRQTAA